jgi:hypothetical protein
MTVVFSFSFESPAHKSTALSNASNPIADYFSSSIENIKIFPYEGLYPAKLKCAELLNFEIDVNVGKGNAGVFKGRAEGAEVAIKFPTRNKVGQVGLIKLMSDLGVGPHFYGITYNPNGRIGIITEFISGFHFTPTTVQFPKEIRITQKTMESINRISRVLSKNGIVVSNLQLRINRAGQVFVIDPEFFGIAGSSSSINITLSQLATVRENLRKLLR